MKSNSYYIPVILLVSSILFFANLGGVRLWDRDEPRNAGCAEEMMKRGDWVTPIFNDELRSQKPVLLYWLMISAYSVFGFNEFGARFWSAALSIGTICLTFMIGKRLFNPRAGFWAAIALSTSLMFIVAGRAATPDAPLIFFTTLSLTLFVYGAFPDREKVDEATLDEQADAEAEPLSGLDRRFFPNQLSTAVWMYSAMGVAVLAKGPIGILVPCAIIGLFLLISRTPKLAVLSENARWHQRLLRLLINAVRPAHPWHFLKTCWSMRLIMATAIVLLIAAPWYVAVGVRTEGDFLKEFFLNEHFGRATTALENHNGGVFFYPMAILAGFFPWSVFAVPLMIFGYKEFRDSSRLESNRILFLCCWVAVYLGLFTIAKTKLPSYVTPCYPALALMTGFFLDRRIIQPAVVSKLWIRGSFASMFLVGLSVVIGLPIAASKFLPGEQWLGAVGASLLFGALIIMVLENRMQHEKALQVFGVSAILFAFGLFVVGADRVDKYRETDDLLGGIESVDDAQLATYGILESSWVYYARRPIYELELNDGDPFVDRMSMWKDKPRPDVTTFFATEKPSYLITLKSKVPELIQQLPTDHEIIAETNLFLKEERLVVIRHQGFDSQQAASEFRSASRLEREGTKSR